MMGGGGYGMFGGLMMVAFWVIVVGLIVLAVRGFSKRSDTGRSQSATDVLRERYLAAKSTTMNSNGEGPNWSPESAVDAADGNVTVDARSGA